MPLFDNKVYITVWDIRIHLVHLTFNPKKAGGGIHPPDISRNK